MVSTVRTGSLQRSIAKMFADMNRCIRSVFHSFRESGTGHKCTNSILHSDASPMYARRRVVVIQWKAHDVTGDNCSREAVNLREFEMVKYTWT